MIDANSAERRFNYFRQPFLEIDDPAIAKFLLSSHFPVRAYLVASLHLYPLFLDIRPIVVLDRRILRHIEIRAVDETAYR